MVSSAKRAYCCQFYYRGYEQYGNRRKEYDDVAECVTSLLHAQADHENQRMDIVSGTTGKQMK